MNILGKDGVSGLLSILSKTIFVGGLGILIFLPMILHIYLTYQNWFSDIYYCKLLALLYPTGLLALFIIYHIIKILGNINLNQPFAHNNIKHFSMIGYAALIISFLYLVALPFVQSFFMIIIVMIFTILGLFTLILSALFKKAIAFKEENDLTI